MRRRFHFAEAFWFRIPLKTVVVALCVFGILTLWPPLAHGSPDDQRRALFGLIVLGAFAAMASVFIVAVNDSYVEVDDKTLRVRFEAFFNVKIPLADVVAVREVDPRPRWRYRWGLSTDFRERLSCSHGGRFVEIELARPCATWLWPRRLAVRRFWFAVQEHDDLLAALREVVKSRAAGGRPLGRAA